MIGLGLVSLVCVLGCERRQSAPPPKEFQGPMKTVTDRFKTSHDSVDFKALKFLVEKETTPELVETTLGKPLAVETKNGRQCWLYVKPEGTNATDVSWWLTFGENGKTAGWISEAPAKSQAF
jgi:hypothetical protein